MIFKVKIFLINKQIHQKALVPFESKLESAKVKDQDRAKQSKIWQERDSKLACIIVIIIMCMECY